MVFTIKALSVFVWEIVRGLPVFSCNYKVLCSSHPSHHQLFWPSTDVLSGGMWSQLERSRRLNLGNGKSTFQCPDHAVFFFFKFWQLYLPIFSPFLIGSIVFPFCCFCLPFLIWDIINLHPFHVYSSNLFSYLILTLCSVSSSKIGFYCFAFALFLSIFLILRRQKNVRCAGSLEIGLEPLNQK